MTVSNKKIRENDSEIINQKKQFIFEVDQTSDFVFPKEQYKYFIYIKNISGTTIDGFTVQLEKTSGVIIENDEKIKNNITLKPDEVLLYEIKAYCSLVGEETVHFIGFGNGTQLLHRSLTIKCTREYNNDTVLHRLHIYDFTPYEEKYSLEADNYSNEVTQTFKRQKLPYKNGKQPFPAKKEYKITKTKDEFGNESTSEERVFFPENIEAQSFLDQYNEAKNTQEHVYQYLSRENFTEDSIESYTGENLAEIFEKINQKSDYFRGKFLKTGTNHLLNDFTQYAPNGFIYRMGLLNSEIYHNLGVIPTYSYMSDRLFRWAPSQNQLLDLIPKKTAMKWNENVWSGRGWIVYKFVTDEYEQTEEYSRKREECLIDKGEVIGYYEDRKTAEEVVSRLEEWDDVQRTYDRSDLIKFEYEIRESLYDTGVFFVNIPINKIPSNFYLLDNDSLYALINRAKPYGTKPIINYILEKTFNQHMDQSFYINYHKPFIFNSDIYSFDYQITQNEYELKTITCEGGEVLTYPAFVPKKVSLSRGVDIGDEMEMSLSLENIQNKQDLESPIEEEVYAYKTMHDHRLNKLEEILEILYQGNYNEIAFKLKKIQYYSFLIPAEKDIIFSENDNKEIVLEGFSQDGEQKSINKTDTLKLNISNRIKFNENNIKNSIIITDSFDRKHEFSVKYDSDLLMDFINYSYIGKNNQEVIKQKGYQNIESLIIGYKEVYNKKILLFLVEDSKKEIHYFHHIIIQNISSINAIRKENEEKVEITNDLLYGKDLFSSKVIFETPFVKKSEIFKPKLIKGGENWNNLERLNDKEVSYSYIKNTERKYIEPNNIYLYYDQINIPETAIIDKLRLNLIGTSSSSNNIYIGEAFNTNYLLEDVKGYEIQLSPQKIECYDNKKESSEYYKIKLETAKQNEQDSFIKYYEKLLEKNYIFNEDIDVEVSDYLDEPNNFITIDNPFWYEISEFGDLNYKLNEIESIKLVIEGYNTGYERKILIETLSETVHSSTVTKTIPSGYFRDKIDLLYPNKFLLELLRVRFRFKSLNHNIKIFDTKIELTFKNKQTKSLNYNVFDGFSLNKVQNVELLKEYYNPSDINNGTVLELSFDDLKPGDYYHINSAKLEVIYTDTDMDMMVNDNKYKDIFYGINMSSVSGKIQDAYLSGLFYNDVSTMMQLDDNVGIENKGIKLQDTLYQQFETRADNITSIEVFPYGFKGNPDETLRIGLYTNSNNVPGKLLKEVNISGWVKNNEELKKLGRIKYNFNIEDLKINEKYWFKIQVLNPEENSYYLLKGVNKTKPGFKLLSDENNNYINTLSNLKFNIYSRNLSKSFNNLPVLQEYLDNPYILIGLHKNKGSIENLQTDKYIKSVSGDDYMGEVFEINDISIEGIRVFRKHRNGQEEEVNINIDNTEEVEEGE